VGEGRISANHKELDLRRIVIAIAAACALAATLVIPAQAKFTGLKGEVTGNFQIKLRKNGVLVKTLKAGRYQIKIEDETSAHNFHLFGPGVNKRTSVAFVGERIWTVTFRKGTYRYVCDPHSASMRGSFRVT
jgi:hypothetical protein